MILDEVAPIIRRLNQEDDLSILLLAGRHPLFGHNQVASEAYHTFQIGLKSQRLGPLEKDHIEEMIRKFFLARYPNTKIWPVPDELLSEILQVTYGHIGFVKTLLESLVDKVGTEGISDETLPDLIDETRRCIRQFSLEINKQIPLGKLGEVFETRLCVFRLLILGILDELNIAEMIDKKDNISVILRLWHSQILDQSNDRVDRVIRGIKAQDLKSKEPALYIEAHQKAKRIFEKYVGEPVSEDLKTYINEWLFHSLNLLIAEGVSRPEAVRQIKEEIEILPWNEKIKRVGPSIAGQLSQSIQQDQELLDLMQGYLGTKGRTSIFNHLAEIIDDLFATMSKEENND
jgi:hypothetical protein